MYVELVLSDYDNYIANHGTPDSTPEKTPAGIAATHARALETFKDIMKCLTCVNFDGDQISLNLSANVRDSSVFIQNDANIPTYTSFLSHTSFGPTLVSGDYDYTNWSTCQNIANKTCETILQFDTQDIVLNADGTVDTTNSIMAYLYVKMEYKISGVNDLPMIITLSLLKDGSAIPTTVNKDLSQTITFTPVSVDVSGLSYNGVTSYKLILSLSPKHLYMTGISSIRNFIDTGSTVKIHTAALLTKYTPLDVWYKTPVEENRAKFSGLKPWAFIRVFTKTPSASPFIGCTLNMFSNKSLTLVEDTSLCKVKWSSTLNIMHSSSTDQGKLPIYLISDENKQPAMYMQHLNIASAGGLAFNADVTSNNNIYWMQGQSGGQDDIITDVFGRSYKLFVLNYDNSTAITLNYTSTGPADTKKYGYPKLAIPMF
jgi:hypothetical protein